MPQSMVPEYEAAKSRFLDRPGPGSCLLRFALLPAFKRYELGKSHRIPQPMTQPLPSKLPNRSIAPSPGVGKGPSRARKHAEISAQTEFRSTCVKGFPPKPVRSASQISDLDLRFLSAVSSFTRFASLPSAPVAQLDRVYDFGS
jgi:hypothetical protein